jgi:tRNA 2-thiouridine synthesizing protein B
MILHTLSAPPGSGAFRDCLSALAAEDAIILLGDGVYAALPDNPHLESLLRSGAQVHVLEFDARAAGVVVRDAGLAAIDMEGFVTLTERYPRQMAWF